MHQAMKSGKVSVPEVRSLDLIFKCDLGALEFPQFNYIYSLYAKYDQFGVLPFPGSHSEQPAKIIEIFDVISAVQAEEEKRLSKK